MSTAHYSVTITNEPPITDAQWEWFQEWATAKTVMCVAAMEEGANKRAHIQAAFEATPNHEYAKMLKGVLGIDRSNKTAVQVKKFTMSQTWAMMAGGYVTKEGGDVWSHNCDLDSDDLVNGKIQYETAKKRGKELCPSTMLRLAVDYAKEHDIKELRNSGQAEHYLDTVVRIMCVEDNYSLGHRCIEMDRDFIRDEFKCRMSGKRSYNMLDGFKHKK